MAYLVAALSRLNMNYLSHERIYIRFVLMLKILKRFQDDKFADKHQYFYENLIKKEYVKYNEELIKAVAL